MLAVFPFADITDILTYLISLSLIALALNPPSFPNPHLLSGAP